MTSLADSTTASPAAAAAADLPASPAAPETETVAVDVEITDCP